ncbi:putative ABC-type xenobiotic transporter [Dioscorea sansibarensis]
MFNPQNIVLRNDTVTPIVRTVSHRSTRRSTSRGSTVISWSSNRENGPEKALEKDESGVRKQISIKRLASLNKPEAPVLALGSIAAAIGGLTLPVFGLLLSSAIHTFYEPPHELRKHVDLWALRFLALGFACSVVSPAQEFLFGAAAGKLIEFVRFHLGGWCTKRSVGLMSPHIPGSRLSADATIVRSIVGDSLSLMVKSLPTVIAGLVIAMIANWKLTFTGIALLPLIGLQGYAQMKFLKGVSADAKVANDAVGNIRTVVSFCAEMRVMDTYKKKCEGPLRNGVRQGIISGLGFGFSFAVLYVGYAICFYAGAHFIHLRERHFQPSLQSVSHSSAFGPDTNKAKDSATSIFEILHRKSKIDTLPVLGFPPSWRMARVNLHEAQVERLCRRGH